MTRWNQIGKTATSVFTEDGITKVLYHSTIVVRFSDDQIELDSGGWRTPTTKVRMNQTSNQFDLGYSVYQQNHEWFVDYQGETYEFDDGLTLQR